MSEASILTRTKKSCVQKSYLFIYFHKKVQIKRDSYLDGLAMRDAAL